MVFISFLVLRADKGKIVHYFAAQFICKNLYSLCQCIYFVLQQLYHIKLILNLTYGYSLQFGAILILIASWV